MVEEGTAAGWRARGGARGEGSKLIRASKRVQLTNEPTPSLVPTSAATPRNPLSLSLLFCSHRSPYLTAGLSFDELSLSGTSRISAAFGNNAKPIGSASGWDASRTSEQCEPRESMDQSPHSREEATHPCRPVERDGEVWRYPCDDTGYDSEGWDSLLSLFHTAGDCMKAHVRIVQGVTVFPGFADDLNGVKQSYFIFSIDNSARYLLKIDFFLVLFFILYNGERGMSQSFLFYSILFYWFSGWLTVIFYISYIS